MKDEVKQPRSRCRSVLAGAMIPVRCRLTLNHEGGHDCSGPGYSISWPRTGNELTEPAPDCLAAMHLAGGEKATCNLERGHEEDHEVSFGGRRFRWSRTAEEEAMRRVALADANQSDTILKL